MNPQFLLMLEDALVRGFEALVLTNAMQPMQRSKMKAALLSLNQRFGQRLQFRVSLDHYTQPLHEAERGPRSWSKTITGLDWLSQRVQAGARRTHLLARGRAATPGRATRASSPNVVGASMRQVPPSSCCCRRCNPNLTYRKSPTAAGLFSTRTRAT